MAETQYRHVQSRTVHEVLVLTITVPELRNEELSSEVCQELKAMVDQPGISKVVLDMEKVQFMASTGIQTLLNFRRYLRDKGGQLLLCSLTPFVADVLFATRLAGSSHSSKMPFGHAADVATAVAGLSGVPSDK